VAKYSVDNPSPVLSRRKNLQGAEAGRAARFQALDSMIQRRQARRKSGFQAYAEQGAKQSTPKGATPQFKPVEMEDMEDAISGKSNKKRGY